MNTMKFKIRNTKQNIRDQMALFNQLTLHNILNGKNNLGTPKSKNAVAAITDEQRDDALVFLECNTEELSGLPDGHGIQEIANVSNLLYHLSTIELNAKGYPVSVFTRSAKRV